MCDAKMTVGLTRISKMTEEEFVAEDGEGNRKDEA